MIKLSRPRRAVLVVGVCLTIVGGSAPMSVAQEVREQESGTKDSPYHTTFRFDHLEANAAQMLVLEYCAQQDEEGCRLITYSANRTGGSVTVAGSPDTLARIGREIAARDTLGSTQRFQVAVVEASMAGSPQLEGLSEGAQQALLDAAKLLPYEGLAVRGIALIETARIASTRVSGPAGLEYQVSLGMIPVVTLDGVRIEVYEFELDRTSQRGSDGESVDSKRLLMTSFQLDLGETVVVGTSRLNGSDSALVVLVTAVSPSTPEE